MVGTAIGIAAWGLITGVAMGKSGLPMALMVFMSLVVFAGSAQLAVLPLMSTGAPVWVVWATALCVNLRFVVFRDRKSTRLNSSHLPTSRMPSSA